MLTTMKRLIGIVFLAGLMVMIAACASAPQRAEKTPAETPVVRNEAPPTPTPTPTRAPEQAATPKPIPPRAQEVAPKPENPGAPTAPSLTGKVILVSLSRQWLYAYEDGKLVFDHAVETGRPELPTPAGSFTVMEKVRNVMFTSPWPEGSPYYYDPTPVNYGLLFKEGGFFLHDASWHEQFGPGSNVPHQLPDGRWETGSHGCVGMPVPAAEWLYNWAPIGTPLVING